MRRRSFLGMIGSAAAWPVAARGQQRPPVVGVLNSGVPDFRKDQAKGFHAGLKEAGFAVGENVTLVGRGAHDRYDRLPALAAELVRLPVAVIATAGGPVSALAAKGATSTIPIVFAAVSDPVRSGLVASLNRPGGNLTGSAGLSIELDAKRLELLAELAPNSRTVGALVNPNRPGVQAQEDDLRAAAKAAGREVVIFRAGDPQSIEAAFAAMSVRRISSLVVGADPFFNNQRQQVIALAARHAIVAVYQWREFPSEGGLVSYGPSITEAYRLSGNYVGRILKGEKPGDLPVVQPSKFELVLNLKTSKALGLAIPPALLARTDEVIE